MGRTMNISDMLTIAVNNCIRNGGFLIMENKAKSQVIDILLWLITIVPMFMFTGFTGMKLWNWLIAPIFGIIELNLIQALGVDVVVTYLTARAKKDNDSDKPFCIIKATLFSFVATALFLLTGFVIHLFM